MARQPVSPLSRETGKEKSYSELLVEITVLIFRQSLTVWLQHALQLIAGRHENNYGS